MTGRRGTIARARRAARTGLTAMLVVVLAVAAAAAVASETAHLSAYPARPVHLIVSFPAGTAVDGLARLVAAKLGEALGEPVVVENRPGTAGNIGTSLAARAAPDGYTLAMVGAGVTIPTQARDSC